MIAEPCVLSAVISVRNEEDQLADCLATLSFADEIVVLLDDCTDGSREIASRFTDRLVDGDWALEGDRRNAGIEACRGIWIFEIDADERVPEALGAEIRQVAETSSFDWHGIPVDNYIGDRLVRRGWGGSWGKPQYPGLFRRGVKRWGAQRLHPALDLTGKPGPTLTNRLDHYVDRNISDMIRRLDPPHRPGPAISGNMAMGAAMPAIFVVSLPGSGNAMCHAGGTGKANTAC